MKGNASNSLTPNNLRSSGYNSRMRIAGARKAFPVILLMRRLITTDLPMVHGLRMLFWETRCKRRMLERGDYYRNGEEQFDLETLSGKLDFDMIDPKIDIRDAETLNKFEQAMRVANIQRYSNVWWQIRQPAKQYSAISEQLCRHK